MNTPICDFVSAYSESEALRLHMPGHKGINHIGIESLDITEIQGADVLYHAEGIIRESEENASELFGTAKTLYSTEGSSLSIRAMLYLTSLYAERRNEKCVIVAGRNAHKVFVTASALLNIDIEWIYPEEESSVVSCNFSASQLEDFISSLNKKPSAVYITSPDYLGNIADIKSISQVCRKNDCLLLVDNAHGAYLNFLPENRHPIHLGADICCDSAHKTLPVLTGGGYLHISKSADSFFSEAAERAMAMFASTSPSYIIMQSLDSANSYLSDGYGEKLKTAVAEWNKLRKQLVSAGYELIGSEPLKLTLSTKSYGYSGNEFSDLLERENIFVEFSDPDYIVMMISPEWNNDTIDFIKKVLLSIPKKTPIKITSPKMNKPKRAITAAKAIFSDSEKLDVELCVGRIAASANVSCPPAIPIVSCGEIIDESAVEAMKYYGLKKCDVVIEK